LDFEKTAHLPKRLARTPDHPNNTAIMSSDSLAMFRKNMGPELSKLAEEHMKHEYDFPADLQRSRID